MQITLKKVARGSVVVVFLALIRCLGEFFRLEYVYKNTLTIETVKPFIVGAMVCAVSSFLITLLLFYSRSKWAIGLAATTIVVLLLLKFAFLYK